MNKVLMGFSPDMVFSSLHACLDRVNFDDGSSFLESPVITRGKTKGLLS